MNFKRTIVRKFVDLTDGWNSELHHAIEERVIMEHRRLFPPKDDDDLAQVDKRISDMRAFYYARMSTTSNLLLAATAVIVALGALIVALIK